MRVKKYQEQLLAKVCQVTSQVGSYIHVHHPRKETYLYLYSITNLIELELTLSTDIGFFLLGNKTRSNGIIWRPSTEPLFYTLRYLFGVNDGDVLALPFAILQERVLLKRSTPAVQYPFIPRLGQHPVLQRPAEPKPFPVQKVACGQIYQTAEDVDPMSFFGLFSRHGTRPRLFAGAVMD